MRRDKYRYERGEIVRTTVCVCDAPADVDKSRTPSPGRSSKYNQNKYVCEWMRVGVVNNILQATNAPRNHQNTQEFIPAGCLALPSTSFFFRFAFECRREKLFWCVWLLHKSMM